MADADRTALRQERLPSICFGCPSYNEGASIRATLASIERAARRCGIQRPHIILSDSSATTETVDSATAWAQDRDVELVVDRSSTRRIGKVARNVLFDRASAEVFVGVDADVTVPEESLERLLDDLLSDPDCLVAIGIAAPDPAYRGRSRRAAAWQLAAAARASRWAPRNEMRAQTALWACRRGFYEEFRFGQSNGETDDLDLERHVVERGVRARSSSAVVLKVPPAGFEDFFLQTERGWVASGRAPRRGREIRSAFAGAVSDPVGFVLYAAARLYCLRRRRQVPALDVEDWPTLYSTKRSVQPPAGGA